jgi:cardiolipin synthase A/B
MWGTADPHTGVQIPPRPLKNLTLYFKWGRYFLSEEITDKVVKTSIIFILIFIFLVLFTNLVLADSNPKILINEVMYDPEENDNYHEWIELYNPCSQIMNLSGWSITDNTYQDFLEPNNDQGTHDMLVPPKNYAIITDQGTKIFEKYNFSDQTICFYVDDKSIGNGLGNTKDKIILKNEKNKVINCVEWGYDYADVPGSPSNLTPEGFTLARSSFIDNNDSSKDFKTSIPTPGYENVNYQNTKTEIVLSSEYIPKITEGNDFSLPFAFKIKLSGFQPNKEYSIKSFIVGNKTNIYPASQTWNKNTWKYSNYYTQNILTDDEGNSSFWTILRFNKNYKEYKAVIRHNQNCFLSIKIKDDESVVKTISKKLFLLEMEKTTDSELQGGFITGKLNHLNDKIIVVEDNDQTINSIYFTEDNKIDEGFISQNGYYKTYSRVGENQKIKFYDKNFNFLHKIEDVSVKQGINDLQLFFEETFFEIYDNQQIEIQTLIQNNGDFDDLVSLKIVDKPSDWNVFLEKENVFLNTGDSKNVLLYVQPNQENKIFNGEIKIQAISQNDPGLKVENSVSCKIMISDLNVKQIKIYDENGNERNVFGCGETIKFKSFVRNLGTLQADDVNVSFYLDNINNDFLIGKRFYDSIGKYQKYPSVWWDTTSFKPGKYELICVVDEEKIVEEIDENNNQFSVFVTLFDTSPSVFQSRLVISELYYHSHPNLKNEYICIYNPFNQTIDISGFYITDEPFKNHGSQNKIIFPENTFIEPYEKLVVTENAETFIFETNLKPDFEYNQDTRTDIPQMNTSKKMVFSNNGENIALKNSYNHTIDFITYGSTEYFTDFWNGTSIPYSGKGVVLKRNFNKKQPVDTNTKSDWLSLRVFKIGQSNFLTQKFCFNGTIQTFVSPDNSYNTIIGLIQKAKKSIYINMYEFTNHYLCEQLIKALKRNISVFLFCEGKPVGGITKEQKYLLKQINDHGGKIHFITSDSNLNIYKRYRFNHAKYVIIDNNTLVLESCNWALTGIPKNDDIGNREWGIIIYNRTVSNYFLKVLEEDSNIQRHDIKSFQELNITINENYVLNYSSFQGLYEPVFVSNKINGSFTIKPVLSPDNSIETIIDLIESAEKNIYIQQLYIYKNWENQINPIVQKLVEKAKQGVKIKIILNYNPVYIDTNNKSILTKQYLEENGIKVKLFYTNWSYFTNIHNKAVIVDNQSVLISSINWNENSFTNNRETGAIIENNETAKYYSEIFLYDWNLKPEYKNKTKTKYIFYNEKDSSNLNALNIEENDNTIYIVVLFTLTFVLIAMDWRKRKWR